MDKKYFVTMAHDVNHFEQSDYLFIVKNKKGELVGYAAEFDLYTPDIIQASNAEKSIAANWFEMSKDESLTPASIEEIRTANLEKLLIGSTVDMHLPPSIETIQI